MSDEEESSFSFAWVIVIASVIVGVVVYFYRKEKDDKTTSPSPSPSSSSLSPSISPSSQTTGPTPSPTPEKRTSASLSSLPFYYPDSSVDPKPDSEIYGFDPRCPNQVCVYCVPESSFKQFTNSENDQYVDDYTTRPFYMIPKDNVTRQIIGTCPPQTIALENPPGQCIDCKTQYTTQVCGSRMQRYKETKEYCDTVKGTHTLKVLRGPTPFPPNFR